MQQQQLMIYISRETDHDNSNQRCNQRKGERSITLGEQRDQGPYLSRVGGGGKRA
jgi:hypothetical protein